MNDLPPIRTAPAAQRNRRSQRWNQQPPAQMPPPEPTRQPPAEWQHFWPAEPQPETAQPQAQQIRRAAVRRKSRRRVPIWVPVAALALLAAALALHIKVWNDAKSEFSRVHRALEEQTQREKDWADKVDAYQVKYRDLIEYYAALNSLNPAYVSAIIKQESNYDPRAVSSKNARGLMQFMPDTFDWVSKNCGYRNADISILFEPEPSIKMGCYLLRYIINHLGTDDPILVACAYHAGWGSVQTWLKNYSADGRTLTLTQIPKDDTRHYAKKVLEGYAIYQQYRY
ncbi:MAG: lytic transglycosylase domain-containing protein [Clostridia bacterium]|nr:lytic transglycosylase domain-containing protein [Clostridia bacterium]